MSDIALSPAAPRTAAPSDGAAAAAPPPGPQAVAPHLVPPPVAAPAGPARIRTRHRVLALSFIAMVLLPMALTLVYLFGLARDQYVSEMTYRTAQAAHDLARARAERQSLYLATYITPTTAEMSEYPRRWLLSALGFLFLTLTWVITVLIGYSLRDRG